VSAHARCVIYKPIIAPHFEYCAILVIHVCETQLERGIGLWEPYCIVTDARLNITLQFMSVKQRLYYSVCIFIYKILNNTLSVSLRNKIEIVGGESQTRQAGNVVLGLRKTRNAQKSVFYEGVKMYSSLPLGIKQCDGLKIFKRELKECILNTIQYF